MGMFYSICTDCTRTYIWYSFTHASVARGARCDDCWRELGINPDTLRTVEAVVQERPC